MKYRKTFFLLILVLLFCEGCSLYSKSQGHHTSYYSGNVKVTLAMGNRSLLPQGEQIPVEIVVTGDYASNAHKVALIVPSNTEDFYCYQKPITKNQKDTVTFLVSVAKQSSQMVVEILDAEDHVIYSRTCSYQFVSEEEADGEVVIGIVSDSAENIFLEEPFIYADKRYVIRTMAIHPQSFAEMTDLYSYCNIVAAYSEVLEGMSDKNKTDILHWVEYGNDLILLGSLQDAKEIGFKVTEKITIQSEDLPKILNGYKNGSGRVWLMNKKVFEREIADFSGVNLLNRLTDGAPERNLWAMYNNKKLLEVIPEELNRQGSTGIIADNRIYFGIFGTYLCVILPGIYIVLRKKDVMHLFRLSICVLACLVSLVIWIMGSNTRFSTPFLHVISIDFYDRGRVKEGIYVSTQAPYKRSYQVSLIPDYEISAIQGEGEWTGMSYNSYDPCTVTLQKDNNAIQLEMKSISAFVPQYFKLTREWESDQNITAGIWNSKTGVQGVITNNTGMNLSQIALMAWDKVILIESLEADEALNISEAVRNHKAYIVSAECFLQDSYNHSWNKWNDEYHQIYRTILEEQVQWADSWGCIIAKTESDIDIQCNQKYPQKEAGFIVTGTKLP